MRSLAAEGSEGEEGKKQRGQPRGRGKPAVGNNMGAILIVVFGLEHMHTAIQVAPACLNILPDIL